MFENLRSKFETTYGKPLTIADGDIERIIASSAMQDEYLGCETDVEKTEFAERHAPDIMVLLAKNAGIGAPDVDPNTGAAYDESAADKKKKDVVEPTDFTKLSQGKQNLIAQMRAADMDLKKARTIRSTIDKVLIARPCPTEWMQNVPECPTDVDAAQNMLSHVHDGDIETWLASAADKAFIVPTSAQLAQLAAKHKEMWREKNPTADEAKYNPPAWADNNQDDEVNYIRQMLDGQKPFPVMVATPEGDKTNHVNPWKWSTKGFIVSYPESMEGDGAFVQKPFSINGLRNFLFSEADGAILAPKDQMKSRIVAYLKLVRKKVTGEGGASVERPYTVVRVKNNNAKCVDGSQLESITAPTGAKKKMSVKSLASFLVLRVSKPTTESGQSVMNWRVTRRRLSLTWDEAPEFRLVEKYEGLPGLTVSKSASSMGALSSSTAKNTQDAVLNMYAQLVSNSLSTDTLAAEGLTQISAQISAAATEKAAAESADFT